jgi:NADH-quinone oxidoreductase subunit G
MNVGEQVSSDLDVLFLFGVEPGCDMPDLVEAERGFVVSCTPYRSESLDSNADLLLPIGTSAETSGTFVNCDGRWQSFTGIANPVGAARPGWKVLRVLGNLLDAEGFEYESSEEIRDELQSALGTISLDSAYDGKTELAMPGASDGPVDALDVPMYQVDGVVRRATALQLTPEARRAMGNGE